MMAAISSGVLRPVGEYQRDVQLAMPRTLNAAILGSTWRNSPVEMPCSMQCT